jgi:hypothetical protein
MTTERQRLGALVDALTPQDISRLAEFAEYLLWRAQRCPINGSEEAPPHNRSDDVMRRSFWSGSPAERGRQGFTGMPLGDDVEPPSNIGDGGHGAPHQPVGLPSTARFEGVALVPKVSRAAFAAPQNSENASSRDADSGGESVVAAIRRLVVANPGLSAQSLLAPAMTVVERHIVGLLSRCEAIDELERVFACAKLDRNAVGS